MLKGIEPDLIGGLVVGNSIRVSNINNSIRRDRAEKGSNNSLRLVWPSNIAIAYIEYHYRVNLRRQACRRWNELQHGLLSGCHLSFFFLFRSIRFERRELKKERENRKEKLGFWNRENKNRRDREKRILVKERDRLLLCLAWQSEPLNYQLM